MVLWLCPSLPTETLKWLSLLPILMQESFWWWQRNDRYIISLFPHLHNPFSPSLISLMVSVDVKHCLLTYIQTWNGNKNQAVSDSKTSITVKSSKFCFQFHFNGQKTESAHLGSMSIENKVKGRANSCNKLEELVILSLEKIMLLK